MYFNGKIKNKLFFYTYHVKMASLNWIYLFIFFMKKNIFCFRFCFKQISKYNMMMTKKKKSRISMIIRLERKKMIILLIKIGLFGHTCTRTHIQTKPTLHNFGFFIIIIMISFPFWFDYEYQNIWYDSTIWWLVMNTRNLVFSIRMLTFITFTTWPRVII